MLKIDLSPEVIDFLNSTGHVFRPGGITYMCANPFWYRYIGENEWEILTPNELPIDLREDYRDFLQKQVDELNETLTATNYLLEKLK